MRYRGETTALAVDIKARRAIARAWNASCKLPGWPQQTLKEPPLKATPNGQIGEIFRLLCRRKSKAISTPSLSRGEASIRSGLEPARHPPYEPGGTILSPSQKGGEARHPWTVSHQ